MKLSAERIREISISLRNFSRSDATKVQVDLHDGLESTLTILNHRLKGCGNHPQIEVIRNYGDIAEVECYSGLLNQVFMNILANAIDALEESFPTEPQIQIRTALVNQQVQIQIADNGAGMTPEVQQKIFNQVFTTKAVGKGTGLGLSIAQQIVQEKHGGKITFTSDAGKGTEFTIFLPINSPDL
jgi:signal transduction histidine kinase